jgi:uncharacterized protein
MRVLIDTNVLISYLLTSAYHGTISQVIEAAFTGGYTLVLPDEVLSELRRKLANKEWLSTRISPEAADQFVAALTAVAFIPKPITEPIPAIGRDRKDDFLLAYAAVSGCGFIVTGDPDLLIMQQVGAVKIVSPVVFRKILETSSV